jgi:NhaP-type Na+/H+ or K+/H+ antiporter
MEDTLIIFIIALIVLVYGIFSKSLENLNISGPMVFMFFGIVFSPLVLNIAHLDINDDIVKTIAEIALIIVLFSDSSTINIKKFKNQWKIPMRLLLIGLPLTIIFSTYAGTFFFANENLINILLLALILAPTDAALGKAVVSDSTVPLKIRSAINVESGLNDGIVFPMLITVILLIVGHKELGDDSSWLSYLLTQIVLGFIIGAFNGYIGAKLLTKAVENNWSKKSYKNLSPISLAILSFYFAEYFGGNGFISAFVAGVFFGSFSKVIDIETEAFLDGSGEIFILTSFFVFGLTFIPATIAYVDASVIAYALLSLTLFRMLPVALSLSGLNLSLSTKLFIGWFGPRGIASILYIMIVAHMIIDIQGHEKLYATTTLTIFLSIILHGLSAKPFVALYSKKDL